MFKVLCKISKDLNITWWIAGGAALGWERHKGLIPWDDDIDVHIISGDISKLDNFIRDDLVLVYCHSSG